MSLASFPLLYPAVLAVSRGIEPLSYEWQSYIIAVIPRHHKWEETPQKLLDVTMLSPNINKGTGTIYLGGGAKLVAIRPKAFFMAWFEPHHKALALWAGFEPATFRLTVDRSTNWATREYNSEAKQSKLRTTANTMMLCFFSLSQRTRPIHQHR